ncbi:MAG: hypothetical protein ONB46_26410 [candidate division KSB1 bacterium]|nr:hypothetical protein [candidate division KSB1 bacterium]MDZ7369476.1 hypothetical protein [candidate division KSB1 bacterium]
MAHQRSGDALPSKCRQRSHVVEVNERSMHEHRAGTYWFAVAPRNEVPHTAWALLV